MIPGSVTCFVTDRQATDVRVLMIVNVGDAVTEMVWSMPLHDAADQISRRLFDVLGADVGVDAVDVRWLSAVEFGRCNVATAGIRFRGRSAEIRCVA